jgi:predicted permease
MRIGRGFTVQDDAAGADVAVISYSYWRRRFALSPEVLGSTLYVNGAPFTIIGVSGAAFTGEWVGATPDFWVPTGAACEVHRELFGERSPEQSRLECARRLGYQAIVRLREGVSLDAANVAARAVAGRLGAATRGSSGLDPKARFTVADASRGYSPQRDAFARPLLILAAVVALVLAIACANVANLLLARNAARRREFALRSAIGAGRARIARQLLVETLVLAAIAGAVGLLFGQWSIGLLGAYVSGGPAGGLTPASLNLDVHRFDERVAAFSLGLALLTALLCGLAPVGLAAVQSIAPWLATRNADATAVRGRLNFRAMLIVGQVAISLVLLSGAALFVQTVRNLRAENLGLDADRLLLVWLAPGQSGRPAAQLGALWSTVQQRIAALPGVRAASPSTTGLLTGDEFQTVPIAVNGQAVRPGEEPRALPKTVSPDFFRTIGQPLLAGREFTPADTASSRRVAIINESLARRLFGPQNPIGREFQPGGATAAAREIVGVVANAKYLSPREDRRQMMFYYPAAQVPAGALRRMCLAVRATGDTGAVMTAIRGELHRIDPRLPVLRIAPLDRQLDDLLFRERLLATLSAVFGALAAALACLGLYGVLSYSVTRRTAEIGVRLALGGTPAGVRVMVVRQSVTLVLAGIALGIPGTVAAARLAGAWLFGVQSTAPALTGAAALALLAVGALAALIPAQRAGRIDPMSAIRSE